MTIYKRCRRCQKLFEGSQCSDCSKALANARAKRRQAENDGRKLYGSYAWELCRKNVRLKYLDYDIWLLAEGQVYRCSKPYVHHIRERDEAPALIYDLDNLITVSKESHEEIHRYYGFDKQYALDRIERGKAKFEELFGS